MYQTFHRRPRRIGSYFLPFLSLIILGLIVVLVFQIVDYFQQKRIQALENKAAVKIVTGRAEMKIMGFDQWTAALDGSILHEGDLIRTLPGSRVILTLLNGSVVRLSSETEVELEGLTSKDSEDSANFNLRNGEIWLKRTDKDTVLANFTVSTDHLTVSSLGTIFDVYKGATEAVRVINGKVKVDFKVDESGETTVVDSVEIALGQEVDINAQDVSDIMQRRNPSLLELLSDEFRSGNWYAWNRSEDSSQGSGLTVAQAVEQENQIETSAVATSTPETPPVEVTSLSRPEIVSPKENERNVRGGSLVISGTTSRNTDKMEVTTYIVNKAEPYVLQRYVSGSTGWSYVVSQEYGNLLPGRNRYTIVAIAKDGRRSEPAEIFINFDIPSQPADMSAPTVTGFNNNLLETYDEAVQVNGRVGKGIVRVYVNNLPLTRYVPDSGNWTYYAKKVYGNLREGENSYEVYGVDAGGRKTPVITFTINKKTRDAGAAAATSTTQGTSASQSQQQPAEPVL